MNKLILADSQAIFRAGTAKVLAMDEGLRIIAQCTDLDRMYHAITTFPGSIVLFAVSLHPEPSSSDRHDLSSFILHHRVLTKAAAEVGSKIDAEEQSAPSAVA